jgi:hypothetical protein
MIVQKWKDLKQSMLEVYSGNHYFMITFLISVLIYSLNALIHNYKLVFKTPSLKLIYLLIIGFPSTTSNSAFLFLIIISVLSGIVISMSIFLLKRQLSSGYAGTSGVIVGLIAPACPSCALGLFGVIGLGGFLTILPFKGLELGVLGILLLISSMNYLSKKIVTKVCKI